GLCRQLERGPEHLPGARVGEIEMQPEPARPLRRRSAGVEFLGAAIGGKPKGADEPRQCRDLKRGLFEARTIGSRHFEPPRGEPRRRRGPKCYGCVTVDAEAHRNKTVS